MGWIRIRMDPELLPGSGSGTRKIQSWIWIRNKSFRIHNNNKNSHYSVSDNKTMYFSFLKCNGIQYR